MFPPSVRAAAFAGPLLLAACASDNSMQRTSRTSSLPTGPTVISGSGSTTASQSSQRFGAPTGPVVAGPPGCAGPIGEFQQLIDSDAETGYLNPGVYNRVTTDLGAVKQACAAGREGEARNQLTAVKGRYGYR